MENRVCLVTFGDNVSFDMWDVGADEVETLSRDTYRPNGYTPMLDAVGLTITRLLGQLDIGDENVAVLCIVISDGMENYST